MRQIYQSNSQSERAKVHLICKIYTNLHYCKKSPKHLFLLFTMIRDNYGAASNNKPTATWVATLGCNTEN